MLRLQDLRIIMDRDESCTMPSMYPPCSGDYSLDQLQIHRQSRSNNTESIDDMNSSPMSNAIIDMFSMQQQHQLVSSGSSHALLDKTNFTDVMSFADYGPKLALQIDDSNENREGFDPVYFLKFPVLASDHKEDDEDSTKHLDDCLSEQLGLEMSERGNDSSNDLQTCEAVKHDLNLSGSFSMDANCGAQSNVTGMVTQVKQKRKRTRAVKNSEEVESQRMTHIAVERNRRKQMNEHLRVLRSLMPGSYVQRGDQASIIGGAIEFVRELEQLLQCLESQKRRRMIAEVSTMRPIVQQQEPNPLVPMQVPYPVYSVNNNNNNMEMKYVHDHGSSMYDPTSLREDVSDSKSAVADVEVKLLGYDAMIKILSQRRPGQLLKTIAALETQLQFSIMHTNVTTIEHTVLYSFNVKIGGECKVTAEEIANAVQQIFNMIHASSIGYIKE